MEAHAQEVRQGTNADGKAMLQRRAGGRERERKGGRNVSNLHSDLSQRHGDHAGVPDFHGATCRTALNQPSALPIGALTRRIEHCSCVICEASPPRARPASHATLISGVRERERGEDGKS